MILTFILAAVAGAFVPRFEPVVTDVLGLVFDEETMPDAAGRMVAAFAAALFLVAILAKLLGIENSPAALALGGGLGYLHEPIRRAILDRFG